ncbi:hypothetical protein ACRALDRAFT_1070922 [Sodiomyces alcalophilus JCM 7366]|uniref:uncharacterized protein n=1 Tax=Sodiomyces alcalophilus JCM 7366 TaxID=591952 RepID=UPI0039B54951
MATTPSPATVRSLYRSLLRELPPRPLLARDRSPLQIRLRETFSSPESAHSRASAEARQYIAYLRAQRTYAALVDRYNPGMNMDEEERVRLTARRVGMNLPVEFEE